MCFEQSKLEQYVCTINIIIHDICKTIDEWMSKIKLHASNFKLKLEIIYRPNVLTMTKTLYLRIYKRYSFVLVVICSITFFIAVNILLEV